MESPGEILFEFADGCCCPWFSRRQSQEPGRIAALKHFAGKGAAEGGRDYNTAIFLPVCLGNFIFQPIRLQLMQA